jgi:hypothetical protein
VGTYRENLIRLNIQRLADLKKSAAELERELSDTGVSFEHEIVQSVYGHQAAPDHIQGTCDCATHGMGGGHDADGMSDPYAQQTAAHGYDGVSFVGPSFDGPSFDGPSFDGPSFDGPSFDGPSFDGTEQSPDGRTAVLINQGRSNVYHRGLSSFGRKAAAGTTLAVLLVTILVVIMSGGGASWPPSVAKVQSEITRACQNPDVESEPGQINFACGKTTRQILWVFSLITSGNNSNFTNPKTGRIGLEPIAPAQGWQVASSLNLHHPYNPLNPIDSLAVAARAINDIIGGATLTGANGNAVVQAGLEGNPANCSRYTGSAAIISRQGFPDLCAKPVSSPAGQAALVADVYRKWVVGAGNRAAQDAAVLFENAKNPGDPGVQSILKRLPTSTPPA